MYDFAVRGTVVGFFNSKDNSRTFIKVMPEKLPNLERDERATPLTIVVPQALVKNFAMNSLLVVRGKACTYQKDVRCEDGKVRTYTNFDHEAESIEMAKAA